MTTAKGGLSSDPVGLVVASAGLTHKQTAEATPAVRRLRTARLDTQWHHLLDGVYASLRGDS